MSADLRAWIRIVAMGVILGSLTLAGWPPYEQYAVVPVPGWLWAVSAVVLAALGAVDGPANALLAAALLMSITLLVPVVAAIVTARLVDAMELVDIMLLQALRRAIGVFLPLLVLVTIGVAGGVAARARRDG